MILKHCNFSTFIILLCHFIKMNAEMTETLRIYAVEFFFIQLVWLKTFAIYTVKCKAYLTGMVDF